MAVFDDCRFCKTTDFGHPTDVLPTYLKLKSFIVGSRFLRWWPMRIDHPHEAANRGGISNAPSIHVVRRVTMLLQILPLLHFNKAVEIVKLCLLRLSVLFPKVIQKLPDRIHDSE